MNIINQKVMSFEEGKIYVFVANTIESRHVHKWAELVDGQIVDVRMPNLGFVMMHRHNKEPKEMMVLPKFCYEVTP